MVHDFNVYVNGKLELTWNFLNCKQKHADAFKFFFRKSKHILSFRIWIRKSIYVKAQCFPDDTTEFYQHTFLR